MVNSRFLLSLVCLLLSGAAVAGTLKVEVALRGEPSSGKKFVQAVWKVVPAGLPTATASAKEVSLALEIPGLGAIKDLSAGTYRIEIMAPGFWHPPEVLTIGDSEAVVKFHMWPTARIHGQLKTPAGEKAPPFLRTRFQSAPEVATADRLPPTQIDCAIAEGKWSCEVPAGSIDLRFYARHYVTHFRWGIVLAPGEESDIGTLTLRRSASVVGQVRWAPGTKPDPGGARVIVEPLSFGREDGRTSIRSLFAVPNARGYFQVEGVPPGEYSVVAMGGKLSSVSVTVAVIRDTEVELLEPLVLEPLKKLELSIIPEVDNLGKPWRVRLTQSSGPGGQARLIAEETASREGVWTREQMRSGSYWVSLISSLGSKWLSREIIVDRDAPQVVLHVEVTRVDGTVKFGGHPIAARLHFGGEQGATSVALESDGDGHFSGILPTRENDTWHHVTVVSSFPPLKRELDNVKLTRQDEVGRVDIELPSTHLQGEVVDEENRPVSATVNINGSGESLVQTDTENDGTFELFGMPPGAATLQASAYLRDSDPVSVQVSEDQSTRVRLVLRPTASVVGRVVSTMGPVAGARVSVNPTDTRPLVVAPGTTQASGEFFVTVQAGSRELNVFVQAPGFAYKMFHMLMPEQPIEIPLDQQGGTIIIDCPQFEISETARIPRLVHSGAHVVPYLIGGAKFEKSDREGSLRIRVPMVERGQYSVCLASSAEIPTLRAGLLPRQRCASGFVPPLGELKLTVPAN